MDRALDLIERLRAKDQRFKLYLKGRMPWELGWAWNRDDERSYMTAQLDRISSSPLLAEGVVFDEFGPDVMSWLRKIGFILSPSEDESFHIGLAEGMASRAIPVIWGWPGAGLLYPNRYVHGSTEAAGRDIFRAAHSGSPHDERESVRAHVVERFAAKEVYERWFELVSGRPDREA